MDKYKHIRAAIFNVPWVLQQSKLSAMVDVVVNRMCGEGPRANEWTPEAATHRQQGRAAKGVAVIPVHGVLSHRMNMMTDFSGGTSTEILGQQIDRVMADSSVGSVVLDIDSPGGEVSGVVEVADKIFGHRGTKPIVAVANADAHSGAYWIASQADEFVITPSGRTGSIGVYITHVDDTEAEEQAGVKTTLISAGDHKTELYQSLDDDAKAHLQTLVDGHYSMFTEAVARGRGVSNGTVLSDFGGGRFFLPQDAKARGMVDGIETLESVVSRLTARQSERRMSRAQAEKDGISLLT